jgi:hypothetical protein
MSEREPPSPPAVLNPAYRPERFSLQITSGRLLQGCVRPLPARARIQMTWDGEERGPGTHECGEIDELK